VQRIDARSGNPAPCFSFFLHDADDEEEVYCASAAAAAASAAGSAASSGSTAGHPGGPSLWARHCVTATAAAALPVSPVSSSSALLSLLAAVRHPSSDGSFTGKSLLHTLEGGGGEEAAMHSTDRAHFFTAIVPFLAHMVL
jgi:hypothetical protein